MCVEENVERTVTIYNATNLGYPAELCLVKFRVEAGEKDSERERERDLKGGKSIGKMCKGSQKQERDKKRKLESNN